MANIGPFEMLYGDSDTDFPEEDPEEDPEENRRSVKETLQSLYRVARELAPRAEDERLPVYDDEEDFDEIKDPLQQAQEIKPKLTRDEAATLDAVKNVFEKAIQLPALKNICDVHHLDQQILTKVLENLNNSITQETLNQLTNRRLQLLGEDSEKASPVPLQVPPHDTDKVQPAHEHKERKRKLPSYIPDSAASAAAAAAVNNVSEEMTQLPASKKIRYAHDDVKSPNNLITQETSINLRNVSEQVAENEMTFLASCGKNTVEGVGSTKDDINANDSVDTPKSKTLGKSGPDYADGGASSATKKIQKLARMEKLD